MKNILRVMFRWAVAGLLVFTTSTSFAQKEKMTLSFMERWPPYAGAFLKNDGVYLDLVRTVFEYAGYDVELVYAPHARTVENVKRLKWDVQAGLWEVPFFKDDFDFFANGNVDKITLMVLKESKIKSGNFEDLKGLTVGLVRGGGYPQNFLTSELFKRYPLTTQRQCLEMLAKKRLDAIIVNSLVAQWIIDHEVPKLKDKTRLLEPLVGYNLLSPAISKKHPKKDEMISRYNKAFKELREQGLYEKLFKVHGVKLQNIEDLEK